MLRHLGLPVATALALASLVVPARALAQDAQADAPAIGNPPGTHRWSVARDLAAVLPVGAAAVDAGPMLGPLVRPATRRLPRGARSPLGPRTDPRDRGGRDGGLDDLLPITLDTGPTSH